MDQTVLKRLARLWNHLNRRRKWQLGGLLCLMFAGAIAEVISLGSAIPFLAALADPNGPGVGKIVGLVSNFAGQELPLSRQSLLTLLFIVATAGAGAIRLALLWATTRLTFAAGHDLSMEIYHRTLHQPYKVHVSRNSAEVVSAITIKTTSIMFDILLPTLTIANSALVILFVFGVLVLIDPIVALSTSGFFAVCYVTLARISYWHLASNSRIISTEQTRTVRALHEGLGGIRDVLVNGTQALFCEQYRQADAALRRAQGKNLFTSGSPRFTMEAIGASTLALLAYSLNQRGGLSSALPTLGALALGLQRLLPAFQQGYNSWSLIVGNQASLQDALVLLEQPLTPPARGPDRLNFEREICINGLEFQYNSDGPLTVKVDELRIPKGARVGFVGQTGSGKSTLLDILMGLLPPTKGSIRIDGAPLFPDNVGVWQRQIAHVSQQLYLSDASIAENIAFGIEQSLIDLPRVRRAAEMAQISAFIDTLPDGYNAQVGERGVRLSGGQRQRIGIARALYKKATVLILDEATSALDATTELAVMESIEALNRDMTILIIAHRTSTLRDCDFVVSLKSGRIETILDAAMLVQSSNQ